VHGKGVNEILPEAHELCNHIALVAYSNVSGPPVLTGCLYIASAGSSTPLFMEDEGEGKKAAAGGGGRAGLCYGIRARKYIFIFSHLN
jgi:hypothetical protein